MKHLVYTGEQSTWSSKNLTLEQHHALLLHLTSFKTSYVNGITRDNPPFNLEGELDSTGAAFQILLPDFNSLERLIAIVQNDFDARKLEDVRMLRWSELFVEGELRKAKLLRSTVRILLIAFIFTLVYFSDKSRNVPDWFYLIPYFFIFLESLYMSTIISRTMRIKTPFQS